MIKGMIKNHFEGASRISARNPLNHDFGSVKPSLDEALRMTKKIVWGISYVLGVLIFILVSCEIFLRFFEFQIRRDISSILRIQCSDLCPIR